MKILLVELAGIGDAILSTPLIRNLRGCFPGAYIGLLTFPAPAELMKKCPYLDDIFVFYQGAKFPANFFLLNKLRRLRIDMLINAYQLYTKSGAAKMALLFGIIKPGKKVGRNTDNKGFFYDVKVADSLSSERHDVEYKLDLLGVLGCAVKDKYLELWPDDSQAQAVRGFLQENYISDSALLIGINPGGSRPSRRWDWKNFAAAADALAARYNAKIIITGNKYDRRFARSISREMSHQPIDASGRFSLAGLAALLKRCRLFITNDTAPMHIANALNVPLIAIMGPGTLRTAPYQRENCVTLRKAADCSPCYKFSCADMRCLKGITPDMVIEASARFMGEG